MKPDSDVTPGYTLPLTKDPPSHQENAPEQKLQLDIVERDHETVQPQDIIFAVLIEAARNAIASQPVKKDKEKKRRKRRAKKPVGEIESFRADDLMYRACY